MADATDAAVELAEEHNIDLEAVEGTGEDGRIVVDDVRALIPPSPPAEESDRPDTSGWPQGEDYDPREDLGPVRPEDEPDE